MPAEIINGWRVSSDCERFVICPTNAKGEKIPVVRENHFLRLQQNGALITVKRYLHRKEWFWRISTREKAVYDIDVRDELSGFLFPVSNLRDGDGRRIGDRAKADQVLAGFVAGRFQI